MAQFKCDKTKAEIMAIDDFIALSCILEENNIDYSVVETVEEMRDLILKYLPETSNDSSCHSDSDTTLSRPSYGTQIDRKSSDIMEMILTKDAQMKAELSTIYSLMKKFFQHDNFDEQLMKELRVEFNDFVTLVNRYQKELEDEECPIVVAGETSAGKSSLLNLLLDASILPHSVLCSTSTICRIRNSEEKYVVITMRSGKQITIRNLNEEKMKSELQIYAGMTANREDNLYEVVDIYWPLPLLRSNAMIVDTMGIGESEEMTEKLMEYLPKAVAFIYVINSSNNGGVQSDRLLRIFTKQREWEKEGKMQTFDPNCTLFICNKWDQVPSEEETKVWEDTARKLRNSWPSNKDVDIKNCMFKMCTLEDARRALAGLGYTKKFQSLLEGIERLVPASLEAKVKRHADWMDKFLRRLLHKVVARINATKKNEEEKQKMKSDVEERIKKLRHNTEEVLSKLTNEAEKKCRRIASELHQHLMDKNTKAKMFKWLPGDFPSGNDMEVISYSARQIIIDRIKNRIMEWCQTQNIRNITTELFDMFKSEFKLIEGGCREIDDIIEGISSPLDDKISASETASDFLTSTSSLFTRQEKIALVLFAPLWIPLVIGAGLIGLPISLGMVVKDAINEHKKLKKYRDNRESYMTKWAEEVLQNYDKSFIYDQLESSYLASFKYQLQELCENVIPKQIEADEDLVSCIMNDMRGSEDIKKQYQPLEKHCKQIIGQLMVVIIEQFSGCIIPAGAIEKGEEIGSGSYSDVRAGTVKVQGVKRQCAIKSMKKPLEKEQAYNQLTEVKILGKFQHENIVQCFGICYKKRRDHKYLQIIMEYCDNNMESMIICPSTEPHKTCKCHPMRSCHFYKDRNSKEFVDAWKLFANMILDIVHGLAYLHKGGYVHRDLKLTNVLVKGNTAKIADVGFSTQLDMLTGTIIGSPTNMSPEVLQGKIYGTEADIYSLSIMMWEMWYCRKVYSEEIYSDLMSSIYSLKEMIEAGTRPSFDSRYAPPEELKKLMMDCWKEAPTCRPNANEILEKVKGINDKIIGQTV